MMILSLLLGTDFIQTTTENSSRIFYNRGMTIYKCDKCKKVIKDNKSLNLRAGFKSLELCKKCSSELVIILNKEKMLQDGLESIGFIKA